MLQRWGFIYTLGDPSSERRIDTVGTPACELICVGVPGVDDGPEAAKVLLERDVQLIELCGAFAAEGLAAVTAEVDGQVPVGAVFYGGDAATGLHELFG